MRVSQCSVSSIRDATEAAEKERGMSKSFWGGTRMFFRILIRPVAKDLGLKQGDGWGFLNWTDW